MIQNSSKVVVLISPNFGDQVMVGMGVEVFWEDVMRFIYYKGCTNYMLWHHDFLLSAFSQLYITEVSLCYPPPPPPKNKI